MQPNHSILLIDDDPQLRFGLKSILERSGYKVHLAAHGVEGLRVLKGVPVDLVITDVYMDQMDGLQTIRAIRKDHPEIPVFAMSGGSRKMGIDCLNIARYLGASQVLFKPFKAESLLGSILQQLSPGGDAGGSKKDHCVLPLLDKA